MVEEKKGRLNKRTVYPMIVAFVSVVIMVVTTIVYVGYVDSKSNRQWCIMINPLYEAYATTPPATELGRKIADAFIHLHDEFGC